MTVSQFGAKAANYLNSAVHATGADLQRLGALAGQLHATRALDLGCGAGHVSFALAQGGANRVTAYDPSAEMLEVVGEVAARRGFEERGTDRSLGPVQQLMSHFPPLCIAQNNMASMIIDDSPFFDLVQ